MNNNIINSKAYIAELKKALNLAIKQSGLSRYQIADKMNELLLGESRTEVTKEAIDSWTRSEEDKNIPIKYLPYFCMATNSILPIEAILRPLGLRAISGKKINLLELGEAEVLRLESERKRKIALLRLGVGIDKPILEEEENNGRQDLD